MNLKKAIQNETSHKMISIFSTIGLGGIIFGETAAAVTFGIGHLIGVSITG